MNIKVMITALSLCVIVPVGFLVYKNLPNTRTSSDQRNFDEMVQKNKEMEEQLIKIKAKEEADEKLGQYAINMMYRAGAQKRLSDGKKQILARAIVRVANDIFETEANRKALVMVLAIESGFDRFAQSPTGPKGYGQLAKGSFHEAMASCGVTDLHDEDVWETDLNLYAAACYFKKMLNGADNDIGLAAVSYNQGASSSSAKSYAKNGDMTEIEPLRYLSKITFLTKNVTDEKTPGVPSISDLPKAQSPIKVEAKAGI